MNSNARSLTRGKLVRSAGWIVVAAMAAAALWVAFAPKPISVDTSVVTSGPMEVTVDQQGEVRVHDRFVVAAPVAGKLVRVELHDGDPVRAGDVVAQLEVTPLDPRSRQEAVSRLDASRALVREANQRVAQAVLELEQAGRELRRMERLVADRFVSIEAAEKARTAERSAIAALEASRSRAAATRAEEQIAAAALYAVPAGSAAPGRRMRLTAPASGVVLRVLEKSEKTVLPGTAVMVIGDPTRFEVVVDVLSTDAVKIKPGAAARIEQWGGDESFAGRVRSVEPYAFTKVSSLGIEEKRVNVLVDPVKTLGPLGDGYRVEARIVVWSAANVSKIPSSALFRSGSGWAVFEVVENRARLRFVEIGARNAFDVELRAGLEVGAVVISYPSNDVADGGRVVLLPKRAER
ncbi:MAG: efflux RND transporter periplasmic adaptor subunit [Burkholderiales bacterium]